MKKTSDNVIYILRELKRLFPRPTMALTYRTHWQLLVAVVLSAQTTDAQVNKVTKTLFKTYKTLDDYVNANLTEFERAISSIGLYRTKAKHILATARVIKQRHHGKIPRTMKDLISLPGVGRKTANVILTNAFGITEGIAVDTHVARLSKLFDLTKHTDPKKIEQDLMNIIPKTEWLFFTHRMIWYGRVYCTARCRHEICPILKKRHNLLQ